MPLQTTIRPESLFLLALEPPGNVASELAGYRRSFFATLGEASARAYPEAAPLLFARRLPPAGDRPRPKRRTRDELLASAWEDIEGGFCAGALKLLSGSLFLGFDGPIGELAARCAGIAAALGLEGVEGPLPCAEGFFLCRIGPGTEPPWSAERPPELRFRCGRLVLYRLSFGADPFALQSWTEAAAAWRPSRP